MNKNMRVCGVFVFRIEDLDILMHIMPHWHAFAQTMQSIICAKHRTYCRQDLSSDIFKRQTTAETVEAAATASYSVRHWLRIVRTRNVDWSECTEIKYQMLVLALSIRVRTVDGVVAHQSVIVTIRLLPAPNRIHNAAVRVVVPLATMLWVQPHTSATALAEANISFSFLLCACVCGDADNIAPNRNWLAALHYDALLSVTIHSPFLTEQIEIICIYLW